MIGVTLVAAMASAPTAAAQIWNATGLTAEEFKTMPPGGPAPRRDLSGIWDASSGGGVGGSGAADAREAARAPFTPFGEEMMGRNQPGNGPRAVPGADVNDPLVYTKPWMARNRLAMKQMRADSDLMEMIPSASEAQAYRQFISSQTKR